MEVLLNENIPPRMVKDQGVDFSGKYASQITISRNFYDVTAHRYVEDNCFDLGLRRWRCE